MKKKEFVYKLIICLLLVLVLYVSYGSIFNIYAPSIQLKPLIIILGVIISIFLFIQIKKIIGKTLDEKKSKYIAIIICILFFLGVSSFGIKFNIIPYYDLSNLQNETQEMLNNGGEFVNNEYFQQYKNKVPLTIFIYCIYKIGMILGVSNLNIFATVVNAFLITITAFFTYLSVKKIKNYKLGLTTLIFFVLNPIFYIYSSYYYHEIVCMPFAAIALYFFFSGIRNESAKKKIINFIVCGLILAIGFKINTVLCVLLIGIILGLIINNRLNKLFLAKISSLILGFLSGIIIINIILTCLNVPEKRKQEIPPTYWMKLGVNTNSNGGYIYTDFEETISTKSYRNKIKSDVKIIIKRLNAMGVKGWIELQKIKLNRTWTNGEYGYIDKLSHIHKMNDSYEYIVGNNRNVFVYYCQIMKASMLTILIFSLIHELRKKERKKKELSYICIFILGSFLLHIIGEAQEIYGLTYLPWMMLLFGVGIEEIEKILKIKKINFIFAKYPSKQINLVLARKILIITTICVSVLIFAINFHKYTIKEDEYEDIVVLQDSRSSYASKKIADNIIEQTFKTDKEFNSISVVFYKQNTKKNTNYTFSLYNSNDELITIENFDSDEVVDNEYTVFKFKEIKPHKEEEYIIQIYSKKATDNNSLKVSTSWQDDWIPYPNGSAKINDKEIDRSLTFKVSNVRNRTNISKIIYISLFVFIMMIEIFAFYSYLKKEKTI